MNKLLTVAGTALLSLSFISLGFAAQGADSGAGSSTPPSSSGPAVGSGGTGGMEPFSPEGGADSSKKKRKDDSKPKAGAPSRGGEGSNPTLDGGKGRGGSGGG